MWKTLKSPISKTAVEEYSYINFRKKINADTVGIAGWFNKYHVQIIHDTIGTPPPVLASFDV